MIQVTAQGVRYEGEEQVSRLEFQRLGPLILGGDPDSVSRLSNRVYGACNRGYRGSR